jgi:hypothetical protein
VVIHTARTSCFGMVVWASERIPNRANIEISMYFFINLSAKLHVFLYISKYFRIFAVVFLIQPECYIKREEEIC